MQRLRPMMMTTLTAMFGFVPARDLNADRCGSQRPWAIVVIGGMMMAPLLNQYLTPVLYSVFRRQPPSEEAADRGDIE